MGKLMIDEVIGHCERTVERFEKQTSRVILENIPLREPFMKEYWEHRQVAEWLKELQAFKDKQEQGLIAQCTCGNCIYHDCADCSGDTIYCTELGVYRRINDSCNKAEAEEALAKMGGK